MLKSRNIKVLGLSRVARKGRAPHQRFQQCPTRTNKNIEKLHARVRIYIYQQLRAHFARYTHSRLYAIFPRYKLPSPRRFCCLGHPKTAHHLCPCPSGHGADARVCPRIFFSRPPSPFSKFLSFFCHVALIVCPTRDMCSLGRSAGCSVRDSRVPCCRVAGLQHLYIYRYILCFVKPAARSPARSQPRYSRLPLLPLWRGAQ